MIRDTSSPGLSDVMRAAAGSAAALDAALYGASALFAATTLELARWVTYRTWAAFAWPTYTAAALIGLVLAAHDARLGRRRLTAARFALAGFVLAGALAAPLVAGVHWRAERGPQYAASEVVITEGAAADLLRGRNPYATRFASPELAGRAPSIADHFPYLPGMAVFGVPRALLPSRSWTDARVFFTLATALAAAAALAGWRAPPQSRLRALQVLAVLPTGAPLLVAGGDDMPVLALSLLALVLLDRSRYVASSAAAGAAALLKLTAWPLFLFVALAARRSALIVATVVLGVVAAAASAGPASFADDVLLFPLGLTSPPSPAKGTTLGSLIRDSVSPHTAARAVVTATLLAVALGVAFAALRAWGLSGTRPANAAEAAMAAGVVLAALVAFAPIGRPGYLVYPVDLLLWSALLRTSREARVRTEALAW